MEILNSTPGGWSAGMALIWGIVILAVSVFTVIQLRKQAKKAKAKRERNQNNENKKMEL